MELIRVLIANSHQDIRTNLMQMLSLVQDLVVIGEAEDGMEAVQKSMALQPDVVLLSFDIPMLDVFRATERITREAPGTAVIVIGTQDDPDCLKKAMLVGARGFLVIPFPEEKLISTIKNVYEIEKKRAPLDAQRGISRKSEIVTMFGTKGGIGKTTVAVNLAVMLAKCKQKVVLLDLDLQFGDTAVFLNLFPRRTLSELVQERGTWDIELVESYLLPHLSGVKILPAPGRPEYAELVMAEHVTDVIEVLKQHYDYIIIDTPPFFNETNLAALDLSTQILLILAMDLATIKNIKLSLELLDSLQHLVKTKLILNRASDDMGITIADAEETLDFLIAGYIPSEGKVVVPALNEGIPFVLSHPAARASKAIQEITKLVLKDKGYQEELQTRQHKNIFSRFFRQ